MKGEGVRNFCLVFCDFRLELCVLLFVSWIFWLLDAILDGLVG